MEYMNLTVESDYYAGASRIGTGPRRKQCSFWKKILPNLMAAVADTGDQVMRWKQEMNRWENEYIVDWQLHFEQYKKYQAYRYADSENDIQQAHINEKDGRNKIIEKAAVQKCFKKE
uniref:Uncharacterized protein n=1 Tax=Wuchereria bancrofti TaxID=6293 RepID=A0A1I8EGU6_WUCBA